MQDLRSRFSRVSSLVVAYRPKCLLPSFPFLFFIHKLPQDAKLYTVLIISFKSTCCQSVNLPL